MVAPITWHLTKPDLAERMAKMVPSAPLPWRTHPDMPWKVIDANGNEVCASPRAPAETIQTIGIIISAVNTLGGYKAG